MILKKKAYFLFGSIQFFICFMFTSPLFAGGFTIYGHNIDTAMAFSTISNTLGPSSNIFNPALLPEIQNNEISVSTTFIAPKTEFTDKETGIKEDSEDKIFFPSTVSYVHHFNDKITGGFAIYNPFGLGSYYDENWSGRYITVESELGLFNINPNIAFKVIENLNIAVGLDVYAGTVSMLQKINVGGSDVKNEYTGIGTGFGYNVGLLYKIIDGLNAGLAYRSKVKLDFDGDMEFHDVPSIMQSYFPDTGAQVDVNVPSLLYFGISYQFTEAFLLEIGCKFEDWNDYKELKMNLDKAVGGSDSIVIEKNWDTSFTYNMGGKYKINPSTMMLFGFLHESCPIPDETYEPSTPLSDKYALTAGIEKVFGKFKLGAYYSFDKTDDREKSNNVGVAEGSPLNGTFKTVCHSVGFSMNYKL